MESEVKGHSDLAHVQLEDSKISTKASIILEQIAKDTSKFSKDELVQATKLALIASNLESHNLVARKSLYATGMLLASLVGLNSVEIPKDYAHQAKNFIETLEKKLESD